MLTHIVSFKYKADVSEDVRQEHRRKLAGLRSVNGVVDLKVGADVVHSPRSFDTGLVVVFNNRAGLDAYGVDPQHVPVAQFGAGLCEQIVAVDFD